VKRTTLILLLSLQAASSIVSGCSDVCRALDAGGNPDIATLALFTQSLQENQATKGKIEALSQFR